MAIYAHNPYNSRKKITNLELFKNIIYMALSAPFFVNNNIYNYLHKKDKIALSLTCRYFNYYVKEMEAFRKNAKNLAKFIQENCQIVLSTTDLKQFLFHKIRILAVGEVHTRDDDRFLNAILIQACWQMHSQLYLEGGNYSVSYSKTMGCGQCKYLPESTYRHAITWDFFPEELCELLQDYLAIAKTTFRISHDLMLLSFDEKDFSLIAYLRFIKRYFDAQQFQQIYKSFRGLKNPKQCGRFSQNSLFLLQYETICLLLSKQMQISNHIHLKLEGFHKLRDLSLHRTMCDTLLNQHRSGVFVAGSLHIKNPLLISNVKLLDVTFKKQNPGTTNAAAILFLVPLKSATQESITKSFQKHFKHILLHTEYTSFNSPSGDKSEDKVDFIKTKLLHGDPKTFNFDQNHAAMWLQYGLTYLRLEKMRIHDVIFKK